MLYPMEIQDWWDYLVGFWRGTGVKAPLTEDERHRVGKVIQGLSRGLTRDRALSGENYLTGDGLGAYLLYFWPVSLAQFTWMRTLVPWRQSRRALDLASGPGPLALAVLEAGAKEVWAADPNPEALQTARSLAAGRGWSLNTLPWKAGDPIPSGPWDIITLSHGLNEVDPGLRAAVLEGAIRELSPQGRLYWQEPAATEVNRAMLTVRDDLIRRGYRPLAPCLFQDACPALAEENGTCHSSFAWDPPKGFESLAWAARIGKEELKMTWFVYGPPGEVVQAPTGRTFRVVGDFLLNKAGRKRIFLCGGEGRTVLSSAPGKGEPWRGNFEDLKRGDLVRLTDPEARESGLGLVPESRLEVLKRASRAAKIPKKSQDSQNRWR